MEAHGQPQMLLFEMFASGFDCCRISSISIIILLQGLMFGGGQTSPRSGSSSFNIYESTTSFLTSSPHRFCLCRCDLHHIYVAIKYHFHIRALSVSLLLAIVYLYLIAFPECKAFCHNFQNAPLSTVSCCVPALRCRSAIWKYVESSDNSAGFHCHGWHIVHIYLDSYDLWHRNFDIAQWSCKQLEQGNRARLYVLPRIVLIPK